MKHAEALVAITNPTVNSYKRINPPRTASGATRAPDTMTWTGNNRTHLVRLPGPGLSDIRSYADPGKRWEWNSFVSHFTAWEREHTLDI